MYDRPQALRIRKRDVIEDASPKKGIRQILFGITGEYEYRPEAGSAANVRPFSLTVKLMLSISLRISLGRSRGALSTSSMRTTERVGPLPFSRSGSHDQVPILPDDSLRVLWMRTSRSFCP